MDVYLVFNLSQPPLLRLPYPSVDEARANCRATNDGSNSLEPYQLISQYTLEPLLVSVAESLPSVKLRFGTEFMSFAQDADGVTTTVRSGGKTEAIRARYMIGCDGGASPVRKQLRSKLRGEGAVMEFRQALFRSVSCVGALGSAVRGGGKGGGNWVRDEGGGFKVCDVDRSVEALKGWIIDNGEARDTT